LAAKAVSPASSAAQVAAAITVDDLRDAGPNQPQRKQTEHHRHRQKQFLRVFHDGVAADFRVGLAHAI
jgi:hypothetical protein